MLCDWSPEEPSESDKHFYRRVVPPGHALRKALRAVDWDALEPWLFSFYSPDQGRPARSPLRMLKLEFLRYFYDLSDRQVVERGTTDMAFRYFLRMDVSGQLPHPSSLSYFRGRLGVEGFRQVFRQVVGEARENGLVKDRLRLKDATHVIANIAIPTTLALVAQARDKLLSAAEPFDPVRVEGERVNVELLQDACPVGNDAKRLEMRVTHLREVLAWVDELVAPEDAATNRCWQHLIQRRAMAHKILQDQENPEAGDKIRSTVDPEARRAKHGDWFDGYLLDILVDADSEIITEINVLPANGQEAADATELIRQEEAAHGNDIESLSIDGIGFNGSVLRDLENPEGLGVNTFVPPQPQPVSENFGPDDFVENPQRTAVTCPAGQTSRHRWRVNGNRATNYRFTRQTCQACPLLDKCMKKLPKRVGRGVRKNDYQVEYQRVRDKATTKEYESVRAEHPKVERKLSEVMNRHNGRRARYRGLGKVLIQELMACTATNIKRVVRSFCALEATCSYAP